MPPRRVRQLELDLRRNKRGGARPGAAIGGLRAESVVRRIVAAIGRANALHGATFRILHVSVQHDHVHLLAEGASLAWIDACASGAWFDGWRDDELLAIARGDVRRWWSTPPPIAAPKTWLAREGWRRRGRLGVDESPASPA